MKAKWMRQKLLSLVLVMVLLLQCLPAAALGQEGPTTSGPTVTGITVVQLPDKTTYLAGEELDLTGMVVQADFDDASTQIVEPETVEGFDSDSGTKTIVVSYQGHSDEFDVTVEAVADGSSSSPSNAVQSAPKTLSNSNPNIAYQAHYSYKGWIDTVSNGQTAGSTSTASRLEALIITLPGATDNSNLRYRAHVAYVGWQDWTTGGNIMGTTGKSYRLEALQIELTGDISSTHDVYYRVYSTQQGGWMGWAKNGEMSGTTGHSTNLQAVQIKLVPKGQAAPGSTEYAFFDDNALQVEYQSYCAGLGWIPLASRGGMSGTVGQTRRLEGICISPGNNSISGDIRYRAYMNGSGWQDWVQGGNTAGSPNGGKMQSIQIMLTDELAKVMHITYRVHVSYIGWTNWVRDGQTAGGYAGKNIEAIEIKLELKNAGEIGVVQEPIYQGIDVSKHQGNITWSNVKSSGYQFAMIRAGYGKESNQKDEKFEQNYQGAKNAGLMVGAYHYSYALSVAEAQQEADVFLQWIKGKSFDLPVFFDIEDASQSNLSSATLTAIADAFCSKVAQAGYRVGVYANRNWFTTKLDYHTLSSKYDIWWAEWAAEPKYADDFTLWQYTDNASCNGINGRVDADYYYPTGYQSYIGGGGTPVPDLRPTPTPDPSPATNATCTVDSGSLNIRSTPSTNGSILGSIPKDARLTVLSDAGGGWYKIQYGNITGYGSAEFITRDQVDANNATCIVDSGYLNIRSGPSTSSSSVGSIPKDARLQVVKDAGGGWYQVIYNGVSGYASAEFIRRD